MSHARYDAPLVLEPGRSRLLILFLLAGHGLASLALLQPLRVPLAAQAVLLALVGASLVLSLVRYGSPARSRLIQDVHGEWRLQEAAGGKLVPARLCDSYLMPGLCLLRLRTPEGKRRTFVILPDMLDAETLRRLRVRLRQEPAEEARRVSSRY